MFHQTRRHRRPLVTALLLMSVMVAAGCGDDPAQVEEEPEVVTMRLTVGSQTVDVATGGAVTGGPIQLTMNNNAAITAQFLRLDGTPDPLVTANAFRLEVERVSGSVTFTRTGAFAGTLRGTAAGNATISVSLFHIEEAHPDFGPFPVSVTVQ